MKLPAKRQIISPMFIHSTPEYHSPTRQSVSKFRAIHCPPPLKKKEAQTQIQWKSDSMNYTCKKGRILDLRDESIEVGIRGTLDVEVPSTDVVDCFIVDHKCTI